MGLKMDNIKAIIGLGNPGKRCDKTRHNIGFAIVDALAEKYNGAWRQKENMELSDIQVGDRTILLIKPQTFMNSSGQIIPFLLKKGMKPENILVVHDELELPFGSIKFKDGGSHRGHNGLRSIIDAMGKEFKRFRFGISRPENKEEVADYVLMRFDQNPEDVKKNIDNSVQMISEFLEQQ